MDHDSHVNSCLGRSAVKLLPYEALSGKLASVWEASVCSSPSLPMSTFDGGHLSICTLSMFTGGALGGGSASPEAPRR